MPWYILLTHDLLLVCVGLALEVVFTAAVNFPKAKDLRLMGYTYVWMIPIYALVYPLLLALYPRLSGFSLLWRGCLYVLLIYVVEYASGWLLRLATGECPWEKEYRGSRWAVHDLIRLDFAPAWFGASVLYESVFRVLR